jgi:branched-chain amino acid transport system substrate-binding protein
MRNTFTQLGGGSLGRTATAMATVGLALMAATVGHAEDTIKIGVLLIDTGPQAGLKEGMTKAVNLAIEEINAAGGAAGKKLEADFITYPGTPDTAVDGATRAVQKDGAIFVTGMSISAVSPALAAKLPSLNALMVDVYAQADGLTGKSCSPNYFRINLNDSMLMNALGEFLKDKGVKTWDLLSVDYSSGHDAAEKFKALIKSQGGSIGKVLFTPSGTADFGAKIADLGVDPSEGLFVTIYGSDAINLAKQQAQFGLFKKYKMVLGNSFVVPQTLAAEGDGALGVYESLGFLAGEPGAQAEAFVKAYRSKYGEEPAFVGADQYAAIQVMAAAIKKADSTDVNAVRTALAGLASATVVGDVEVRAADHQAARPILINQVVEGADGRPTFQIKGIMTGSEVMPPVDPACKM